MLLKQSTAADVPVGPFLDDTDGKTQEVALTIAQADIRLSKNGGAFAQTNNVAGATHMEKGNYKIPLDATDTGTLGRLRVHVHVTGALPCWLEAMVVPANVYDALVAGSDKLQVDTVEIGGTAQTANDAAGDVDTLLTRIVGTLAAGTHNPQTGDAFARLGAPIGASLSADVADVHTDVNARPTLLEIEASTQLLRKTAGSSTNLVTVDSDNRARANAGSAGFGATEQQVRIKDSDGNLVDGAEVWVTSDVGGANIVAGVLHSDADGMVTFMLDPGSYYLWAQRAGVNFNNPTPFTV